MPLPSNSQWRHSRLRKLIACSSDLQDLCRLVESFICSYELQTFNKSNCEMWQSKWSKLLILYFCGMEIHLNTRSQPHKRDATYGKSMELLKMFLIQHSLTHSWSWALLEKLPTAQLLKNFYGTRRFITVFTRALHWSLSWARSIQSIPSHPISLAVRYKTEVYLGEFLTLYKCCVLESVISLMTAWTWFNMAEMLWAVWSWRTGGPACSWLSVSRLLGPCISHRRTFRNDSNCHIPHHLSFSFIFKM
jgi:hypothetical protein